MCKNVVQKSWTLITKKSLRASPRYDSFTGDLEKSNAEEADDQKSFEELMATKKQELATLELTLETQNKGKADKVVMLSDSNWAAL